MTVQGSDRVNALVRGLKVMTALNDLNDASVGDLSRASGVAKTTVLRILNTLVEEGYVAADGRQIYRVTGKVGQLSRGLVGSDSRQRSVQPILDGLADLRWPVEFLVADGLFMAIAQNNRDKAPIKLSLFERRRFPLLESASGMAYLLALAKPERTALMRAAAEGLGDPEKALRAARRWLKRTIEDGYASRDLSELSPGIGVMAVPVGGASPLGALALVLFRDMVAPAKLAREILPRLQDAAKDIAMAVDTA